MATYRKKLIEENMPLHEINIESAKDASLTHGHPSTLHRYWARRPLSACRATIFASMVDDPSECPDEFPTESDQNTERNRLHEIIKRLIIWKNSNDENILTEARFEIAYSVARNNEEDLNVFREKYENDPKAVLQYLNDHSPAVYDPFCGGGSITLEAQRLGLCARGSDLNPLPVLLTKAMIELPPKFHNQAPNNPDVETIGISADMPWKGTAGLADDIRYYGAWMREEAHRQIGHLYPKVELSDGTYTTVVAWLWARTVPCANPACGIHMPLMTTFQLSKKKGNEHWIKPTVDRESNTISWIVQTDNEGVPKSTVSRTDANCCGCGTVVKLDYVRQQAKAGKMKEIMTAVVAEGQKNLYLSPTEMDIQISESVKPIRQLRGKLPNQAMNLRVQGYGITDWYELFTERQLAVLHTFSDLISETRNQIIQDGATEKYANVVCTYLALAIGRTTETNSKASWWQNSNPYLAPVFTRQAIQMTWNFAEANPFSTSTQNWLAQIEWITKVIENLPSSSNAGDVYQADATTTMHTFDAPIIVTDPPYYDNIGYADLSDFFYVWLRPILRDIYPDLFSGMTTPKVDEMIANRLRFEDHNSHFEKLLYKALLQIRQNCSDKFPTTIFYAYKQKDESKGNASSGWETMLTAIINAGFKIERTWPMRTEQVKAQKTGKNALASSVILVCRPRPEDAPIITRNDFIQELKKELPTALERLTLIANIRPVDLAQAAIGPGMEVYSRYSKVMRVSGEIVPIREVLMHINNEIATYLEKETGELDPESQFCLTWLQQHGYMEGNYGDAETLSKAKDVNINTMNDKVLIAQRGKVRLLRREEIVERENSQDMTAWEGCLRMVWHLSGEENSQGIAGCAEVARAMRDFESAKRLARVLYAYYDARGDASSASSYNSLVTEWQYISETMGSPQTPSLFDNL